MTDLKIYIYIFALPTNTIQLDKEITAVKLKGKQTKIPPFHLMVSVLTMIHRISVMALSVDTNQQKMTEWVALNQNNNNNFGRRTKNYYYYILYLFRRIIFLSRQCEHFLFSYFSGCCNSGLWGTWTRFRFYLHNWEKHIGIITANTKLIQMTEFKKMLDAQSQISTKDNQNNAP